MQKSQIMSLQMIISEMNFLQTQESMNEQSISKVERATGYSHPVRTSLCSILQQEGLHHAVFAARTWTSAFAETMCDSTLPSLVMFVH